MVGGSAGNCWKKYVEGGGRENWLSYGSEPQLTAGISQKALLTIPRKLAELNEIDAQQQHQPQVQFELMGPSRESGYMGIAGGLTGGTGEFMESTPFHLVLSQRCIRTFSP